MLDNNSLINKYGYSNALTIDAVGSYRKVTSILESAAGRALPSNDLLETAKYTAPCLRGTNDDARVSICHHQPLLLRQ